MSRFISLTTSILLIINTLGAQTPVVEIWEIQGGGLFTPFLNQEVTTNQNVVTQVGSDYFFVQTPSYRSDNNQATSDGIMILTNDAPNVEVGNMVSITGIVRENFQRTQIDEGDGITITIDSTLVGLPEAVLLTEDFPSPNNVDIPDLEKVEGMRVTISQAITNSPTNQFGETSIKIGTKRAFREPGIISPAPNGLPEWDGNPEIFEIKSASGNNMEQEWARRNDSGTGVMDFSFGDYVLLADDVQYSGVPPFGGIDLPTSTEATIGCINIKGLSNLENDYPIRRQKVESYIVDLMNAPDIIALQEIRSLAVLEDIANLIKENHPDLIYTPYLIPNGDNSGFVINLGYLVKNTVTDVQVSRLGADEQLSTGGRTHDRPPLLLEGTFNSNPPVPITLLNLHLRSLGGITSTSTKIKRHEAAISVANMVEDRIDENLIVLGDLNAFQFSDGYVDVVNQIAGTPSLGAEYPVQNVVSQPLTNLSLTVPEEEQYSFVFQDNAQILDHCLSTDLQGMTFNKFQYVRGNADFLEDFEDQLTPNYRTSDHDGFVASFDLGSEITTNTNDIEQVNFSLRYPNPFSPESQIMLNLEKTTNIHFSLIHIDGKILFEQSLGQLSKGENILPSLPSDLPYGTYFIKIKSNNHYLTKPIIYLAE